MSGGQSIDWKSLITKQHKKEAFAAGLVFRGMSDKARYGIYQCKTCKALRQLRIDRVKSKNILCRSCKKIQFDKEAKMAGLSILGPGKSANYRLYEFVKCKHRHEFTLQHVRKKNVSCKTCLETKIKSEAKAVGLKVIGKGKDHRYRLYEFSVCGHKKEFTFANIRRIKPRCDTCFENTRLIEIYFYRE